jgi:hypothetical protein
MTEVSTEILDLANILKDNFTPKLVKIADDRPNGAGEVIALQAPAGVKLQSVKPLLDEYLSAPERRRGTAVMTSLQSFVDVSIRSKDASSAMFANNSRSAPSLLTVFNYNKTGAEDGEVARFGDHRALYPFPLSDEWKTWAGANGKQMSQADFAHFIEDHISDVLFPDVTVSDAAAGGDFGEKTPEEQLAAFAKLLGGEFATPNQLVQLSRGLEVHEGNTVKEIRDINTGESKLQFETEHKDATGAPLKVPSLFLIGIPVFKTGSLYRMAVRLRYRTKGGLSWHFNLYRDDKVFEHAFNEAAEQARVATGLPLYSGAPEA